MKQFKISIVTLLTAMLTAMMAVGAVGVASASAKPKFISCVKVESGEPGIWAAKCGGAGTVSAKVVPPARVVSAVEKKWCALVSEPLTEESSWKDNFCETEKENEGGYIRFDKNEGVVNPNDFKASGGIGRLVTEGSTILGEERLIECKTNAANGEFTGPETVSISGVTFEECTGPLGSTCSTGGASGVIETKPLQGTLRYINESTKESGIELTPVSGDFTEFKCEGFLVNETLTVIGKVTGVITPTNTFTHEFTLTFARKGSEQVPVGTGGLLTSGSGTESFTELPSAQESTSTIVTEEEGEVSA